MIVGEPISFSTAGRRHHMHPRKARRYLIQAIDRWPDCMDWACRIIGKEDIILAHAALA